MRASLQNPAQLAAGIRPPQATAAALAADREAGAPRPPEQGFAHLLQDSQRRSVADAPSPAQPVPAPAPAAAKTAPAPTHGASTPAHDAAAPASEGEPAATGQADGKSSIDADADAAAADATSTPPADAAAPNKLRSRPTATRPSGRAPDKAVSASPLAEPGADNDEPKARGLATAAADTVPLPAAQAALAPPTGLDAVLAQWQAAARMPAAGTGDQAEADTIATTGSPSGRTPARGDAAAEASLARPELERSAPADLGVAVSTAAFARADEAAALTARPTFEKLLSHSLDAGVAPSAAASGTAAYSAVVDTAAATTTVNVPTPVDSPDFAPALAMQVSLLTSEGVQTAELHLNPAEMGPVSVQISLEGTQAHVSFGADLAATRQVIEAGMPDLAGALREAGFTLAGGGVSEHASGQRHQGGDARQGNSGRDEGRSYADSPPVLATVRHATRAGGIDLYA